jgi:hypothetical protein
VASSRWTTGLLALGIVAMVTGAGCRDSSDGERSESTASTVPSAPTGTAGTRAGVGQPRDDEIRTTIDAVWNAAGIGPDAIAIGDYAYSFEPDNTACSALAHDDRWFGERGSSVGPGVVDQQSVETAIVGFLEGQGFAVERFRSTHPDSQLRTYRAVNGDVVVYGFLNADGATDVNVRAGPCAPAFTTFDPELVQPDA